VQINLTDAVHINNTLKTDYTIKINLKTNNYPVNQKYLS